MVTSEKMQNPAGASVGPREYQDGCFVGEVTESEGLREEGGVQREESKVLETRSLPHLWGMRITSEAGEAIPFKVLLGVHIVCSFPPCGYKNA